MTLAPMLPPIIPMDIDTSTFWCWCCTDSSKIYVNKQYTVENFSRWKSRNQKEDYQKTIKRVLDYTGDFLFILAPEKREELNKKQYLTLKDIKNLNQLINNLAS